MKELDPVNVFKSASKDYPASVTAIAAYALRHYEKVGVAPDPFRKMCQQPTERELQLIADGANTQHERVREKVPLKAPHVDPPKARIILDEIEVTIQNLVPAKLHIPQFDEILEWYPIFHTRGDHNEDGYYRAVLKKFCGR